MGDPNEHLSKALVPRIYDDLLSKAAGEVGASLHGVVRTALAPVNALVWTVDQACNWAADAVTRRLLHRNVPNERVITPQADVAAAVIVGLQVANPDIREMFANLLATAMDADTAGNTHPSYADVIRQLAPDEAVLLAYASSTFLPQAVLDIWLRREGQAPTTLIRRFSNIGELAGCHRSDWAYTRAYIVNLCRLGVCEVDGHHDESLKKLHPELEKHDALLALLEVTQASLDHPQLGLMGELGVAWHQLRLTEFGANFARACIPESVYAQVPWRG